MIETLALETFSQIFPASTTFKTKFLCAFLINNTFWILVMFIVYLILGCVKKRMKARMQQRNSENNQ
jgi:hypothetical protein